MTKKSFPQAVCETRLFLPTYTQLVEKKIIFVHTPVITFIHRLCTKRAFLSFLFSCTQKFGDEKGLEPQGINDLSTGEENRINRGISTAC